MALNYLPAMNVRGVSVPRMRQSQNLRTRGQLQRFGLEQAQAQAGREAMARQHIPGALGGDPAAMSKVAGSAPEMAMKIQAIRANTDAAQQREIAARAREEANMASSVYKADEMQKPLAYGRFLEERQKAGLNIDEYPPNYNAVAAMMIERDLTEALTLEKALELGMPEGGGTERDKLRRDLRAQGFSDDEIGQFFTNRDRYQFSADMFGNKVVFDRYAGQVVSGRGGPSVPAGRTETPKTRTPAVGYETATGTSGFLANIANTVSDAVGLGLAFPEAEKASTALKTLQNRTELFLTASVPGRESNQVRNRLRELTVTPNSLLQGDERALIRLRDTRDFINGEMDRLEKILRNPSGFQAGDLAAAQENLGQLQGLGQAYDQIIDNFRTMPTAPKEGTIDSGYRFKGGDPADPDNWEKVD